MSEIEVPVSFGELIDKLTILEIKRERIDSPGKLANIVREFEALDAVWQQAPQAAVDITGLWAELKAVNERLWDIEDAVREKEATSLFDSGFVELARSVYIQNDERARIKRAINGALGSLLVEEKSYRDYRGTAA